MKKTIYGFGILLLMAASCKKSDTDSSKPTSTTTTSTDSTTALTGNWLVISGWSMQANVGAEIIFYYQYYSLFFSSSNQGVSPYTVSHDTVNGVGNIMGLYPSISGINYCKFRVNGDTAYLNQFNGPDSMVLAKIN